MPRRLRPLLVGAAIAVATFALAQAEVFAPSAPAGAEVAGDPVRGRQVFAAECAGCHGESAEGGVGPPLAASGLDAAAVATVIEQGRGVMPAGLVSGQNRADVVAYVISIARADE